MAKVYPRTKKADDQMLDMKKMSDYLSEIKDDLWKYQDRFDYSRAVPTGYHQLDNAIGGFERGNLYLLGGAEGIGTTAFNLCVAEKIAVEGTCRVIYVTNQLSALDLTRRMVKSRARITLEKDVPAPEEAEDIMSAVEQLSWSEIYVIDGRNRSLDEIFDDKLIEKIQLKVDLIIIDCLEGIRKGNDELWNDILVDCKMIAETCNSAVFVTTKCKEAERTHADEYRPTLECFCVPKITKYVDCIMTLYKENFYNENSYERCIAEIDILRSYNCNPQRIKLVSISEYGRFVGMDSVDYVWSDEQKNE